MIGGVLRSMRAGFAALLLISVGSIGAAIRHAPGAPDSRSGTAVVGVAPQAVSIADAAAGAIPHETFEGEPAERPPIAPAGVVPQSGPVVRDRFVSVQVNVDAAGSNIPGDAANEPTIAVDPNDANRIVIGWRQFASVASSFREAGYAFSDDGGLTWTFPGVLTPGVFRSDPVLDVDRDGNFYFHSIRCTTSNCGDVLTSADGGMTWGPARPTGMGDKPWMIVDRSGGPGTGFVYAGWSGRFTRSMDGGVTFMTPISAPFAGFPVFATGRGGELYWVDTSGRVGRSLDARLAGSTPTFEVLSQAAFGAAAATQREEGQAAGFIGLPNPGGLIGQPWIAVDQSGGPTDGDLYALWLKYDEVGIGTDVVFARGRAGGKDWSVPSRVNNDAVDSGAWQWFAMMSVAPNGVIDVAWNDTRNGADYRFSELYWSSSADGGRTWSPNVPICPSFNTHLGWPNQNKIGDYYHMISHNGFVDIAYAATFNGEQDVYFMRLERDCNDNGVADAADTAGGWSEDCDGNGFPDECQSDLDGDGLVMGCDPDLDGDGVPNAEDICAFTGTTGPISDDGRPQGDTNGNCAVDLADLGRFVLCHSAGGPGTPESSVACQSAFDYNHDGDIDLEDAMTLQRTFDLNGS